jgi:hypothetical protein
MQRQRGHGWPGLWCQARGAGPHRVVQQARAAPQHHCAACLDGAPPGCTQDSECARKIKEAFFAERGLAGTVDKLPLEKVFELASVKKVRCHPAFPRSRSRSRPLVAQADCSALSSRVCISRSSAAAALGCRAHTHRLLPAAPPPPLARARSAVPPGIPTAALTWRPLQICKTADGYQPHMVSPEKGLRLMASKALDQVEGPVEDCVQDVYALLVQVGGSRGVGGMGGGGLMLRTACRTCMLCWCRWVGPGGPGRGVMLRAACRVCTRGW